MMTEEILYCRVKIGTKVLSSIAEHASWYSPSYDVEYEEEPIGIAIIPLDKVSWIKVGEKWIKIEFKNHTPIKNKKFVVVGEMILLFEVITKAEYDADVAFDLFPTLTITTRPIRTAIMKYQTVIWLVNILAMSSLISSLNLPILAVAVIASGYFFTFSIVFGSILKKIKDS